MSATKPPYTGPGSPQDVPPGSFPIDPATLPKPIRDELTAPDPVAIDTSAAELKDGLNRCPKCGSTDIKQKPGTDQLICLYCRTEWTGERVEEEFGLGETDRIAKERESPGMSGAHGKILRKVARKSSSREASANAQTRNSWKRSR